MPPLATLLAVSAIVGESQRMAATPDPAVGPAVLLQHVSKQFRLPHEQYHTFKERVLHPFRSATVDVLHAVDDVSVKVGAASSSASSGATGAARARC